MAREFEGPLARYVGKAHQVPQLSREQEATLARTWRTTGSPQAADALLRPQLRYVIAIALKYRRYGVPIAELIAEGNAGLVHALKKYEPDRGLRFVTYAAHWIRAYVLDHVIRSWSLVGGGSGALRSKVFFRLRRERNKLLNLYGDEQRADELLAERLGVSVEQLTLMLQRLEQRDVSLDLSPPTAAEGAATTPLERLVSEQPSPLELLEGRQRQAQLTAMVGQALSVLEERERYIVEQRLLADPAEELSLAELGRRLGVSRERARQLEARAKQKLRGRLAQLGVTRASLDDAA